MKRLDLRSPHQKRQDAIASALTAALVTLVFCLFIAVAIVTSI